MNHDLDSQHETALSEDDDEDCGNVKNTATTTTVVIDNGDSCDMKRNMVKTPTRIVIKTNDEKEVKGPKQSWLLRLFESKLFDMNIAITYLYNSKEPGKNS